MTAKAWSDKSEWITNCPICIMSNRRKMTEELDPLGISWQDAPDWCDDCNSNPGEKCPDCGYTHNC
jgi:hypothetical protein